MEKPIEEYLSQLPKYHADSTFKDVLKTELVNMPVTHTSGKNKMLFRYAVLVTSLVLLLGGGGYLAFINPTSSLIRPMKVSAAEILRRTVETYFASGTIYHVKYRHFVDYKGTGSDVPIIYDLYRDNDSDRFKQLVQYPDGNSSWQGFDLDTQWTVDARKKTVKKDLYVYSDIFKRDTRRGAPVDIATQLEALVNSGQLTAEEGVLGKRPIYIIKDTRTGPDKYWDRILVDRNNFSVVQLEKFRADGSVGSLMIYDLQEAIPSSSQIISDIFQMPSVGPEYVQLERHFAASGYVESDYYPSGSVPKVSGTPTTIIQNTPTTLERDHLAPPDTYISQLGATMMIGGEWFMREEPDASGIPFTWITATYSDVKPASKTMPWIGFGVNNPFGTTDALCSPEYCTVVEKKAVYTRGSTYQAEVYQAKDKNGKLLYRAFSIVFPDKQWSVTASESKPLKLFVAYQTPEEYAVIEKMLASLGK